MDSDKVTRRTFLSWVLLGGALVAAYGTLVAYAARFLYPTKKAIQVRDIFVATQDAIHPGKPLVWSAPNGQKVLIHKVNGELLALSNICPHLGCKVHWEAVNDRFFCPCHAGVFNKDGIAVSGPPAAEGKNLKRYDLVIRGDGVYIKWAEA